MSVHGSTPPEGACSRCGAHLAANGHLGVAYGQCTGCGGTFLDRGELQRLAEAVRAHTAPPPVYYPTYSAHHGGGHHGLFGGLFGGHHSGHH